MPEESATVIVERHPGAAEAQLRDSVPPLLARIYAARGITSASELDLSLTGLLTPDALPGIDAAAARLAAAVRDREHIKIIGDFDADGATASALAVSALTAMGAAQVSYLVPNRFEFGYGLTPEIVELALRDEPDLALGLQRRSVSSGSWSRR